MRQGIQLVLVAILVLGLGYVGYRLVFSEGAGLRVQVVETQGEVSRAGPEGRRVPLVAGDALDANQSVVVGANGHAVLGVGEGTRLDLDPASTVRVLEVDPGGVRVELEQGRVKARVRAGSTPLGITSRGRAIYADDADFTVAVDGEGALALQPDRGQVRVEGAAEQDTVVQAGSRLTSMPGREAVMEAVPSQLLLDVGWPAKGSTRGAEVVVEGHTAPYAEVQVGQPEAWTRVRAGPEGQFRANVSLREGGNDVQVRATDALGNTRQQSQQIERDSTAPSIAGSEVQWGP